MATINFVFKTCTGKTPDELLSTGELDWYERYADPREDSGKGVLTANWNHFPRMAASDSHRTPEGKAAQDYNWGKGRRFQDILERMGYKLEWSDQTSRCEHCNGCINESPNGWGDTAHYAILGECEIVCDRILFEISDMGQFDVHFCVWAKDTPVTSLGINEYEGEPIPYEVIAR